jgi:anti-sigma factor RsiW
MMRLLHILYCKWRMTAYVNGELSPAMRRRMARYIDAYPECYADYRRQRDMQRELNDRLPIFGVPQGGQLQRLWRVIEGEVAKPTTFILSLPQIFAYTLALGSLVWMVVVMTTLHYSDGATLVITPPTPDNAVLAVETSNPNRTAQVIPPTFVAIATSGGFEIITEINTVEPTDRATYQNPYPTPRLGE